MSRSRASAKKAGTSFETAIAAHLAATVDDRICRQTKTGAKDRGDIANLRVAGLPVVVECKNTTRLALAQWAAEAETEKRNAGAAAWVICHKRHGVSHQTHPGSQWVTMTLGEFVAMITGSRGHFEATKGEDA